MAQHAYVIQYVPSVNLDEGVWSGSLCDIKTYVNSFSLLWEKKPLYRLLMCTPPPAGLCSELPNFNDCRCSRWCWKLHILGRHHMFSCRSWKKLRTLSWSSFFLLPFAQSDVEKRKKMTVCNCDFYPGLLSFIVNRMTEFFFDKPPAAPKCCM